MNEAVLIAVAKGDEYLEIHPTTLASHRRRGWKECPKREAPAEAAIEETKVAADVTENAPKKDKKAK